MHIPDGYLSPQTYIPLWTVFAGFLSVALRKIKSELSSKNVPYLGIASAFSFLIMMFNIPIPGGTTGHAVGSSIIALVLGPWTAVVAVSVALIIQAIVFGDGGITAIGANCFNMAIVMPFVSYWAFRLANRKSESTRNIFISSFFAGYAGLTIAALLTALEFGIQPMIASSAGKPLYAPYGLEIAVPVMALEHLLLFSIIEGLVTAMIVRFFIKNDRSIVFVLRNKKNG